MVVAGAQRVLAVAPLTHHAAQLAHGEVVVEKGVVAFPAVDDTSPRGPSPNGKDGSKKIVSRHGRCLSVAVEAGNHGYALVVLIPVEEFLAEWEKRLRGHIVIFKHDALVGHGKRPLLGNELRGVTPVVLFLIKPLHVALPVDVFHHAAAGRNAFHIVRPARAVLIEEQARRTCTPHFVEHFAEVVRTVEE
ncbi:hypothetical protein IMSAGC014_02210 [Bacteroidaceae bacterium]|nr:hypothetical protein IMSAGC014_02210 [Bacteroidaceae bacterium]